MIAKERLIEQKLNGLCKLIGLSEPTLELRIRALKFKEPEILEKKNYRMKSRVQSYDLRDSEEYTGLLELEKVLRELKDKEEQNPDMIIEGIAESKALMRTGRNKDKMVRQASVTDTLDQAAQEDADSFNLSDIQDSFGTDSESYDS